MYTPRPGLWALDPRYAAAVTTALTGIAEAPQQTGAAKSAPGRRKPTSGAIAVFDVFGTLETRQSYVGSMLGWTAMDELGQQIMAMMADPAVAHVVLHFDSPGGHLQGCPELASYIFNARGRGKQIIAHADGLCASAAYWCASACDRVYMSPSTLIGSIGVIAIAFDESEALHKAGIKPHIFRAPEWKAEFTGLEPLSDSAMKHEQDAVDAAHQWFLRDVARHRGTTMHNVYRNFGQGRVVDAEHARQHGMVDGVIAFHDLLGSLAKGSLPSSRQTTARADDSWRSELELERAASLARRGAAAMKPAVIRGLAIPYGEPSTARRKNPDGHTYSKEIVHPDAFRTTMNSADDVILTVDHGSRVLARRSDCSLRLMHLASGLEFEADIQPDEFGRDVLQRMKEGELNACSFTPSQPERLEFVNDERCGRARVLAPGNKLVEITLCDRKHATFQQTRAYVHASFATANV